MDYEHVVWRRYTNGHRADGREFVEEIGTLLECIPGKVPRGILLAVYPSAMTYIICTNKGLDAFRYSTYSLKWYIVDPLRLLPYVDNAVF